MRQLSRVYLAGRVTGSTWRGRIAERTGEIEKVYKDQFVYVGPYAVNREDRGAIKQYAVVANSVAQIKSADLVLIRIEAADSFGTFAEVGIASQLGKRIILDIAPGLTDQMWFLVQLARSCPPLPDDFLIVSDFLAFIPVESRTPGRYLLDLEKLEESWHTRRIREHKCDFEADGFCECGEYYHVG